MIQLHAHQARLIADIDAHHAGGAKNVAGIMPTGGGKTVMMAYASQRHQGANALIAHRQELLGQMSLALARNGVRHRLIGSTALIKQVVRTHMDEVGRSYYDALSRCGVAGIDTLVRMDPDPWFSQVTLWQMDETHHLLEANKWGRGVALFPNARGIGWTATPGRADGKGLGRGPRGDGVMDAMCFGPDMRWLIQNGYLSDYRIFCPLTEDLHIEEVPITAGGDFSPDKMRAAVKLSHIVGDVVKHYLRIAPGKLGLTFAVDVEHATDIARAYRAAGVRAEVVTGDTPDILRAAIFRRFKNRELEQIVSVDIIGEGLDIPALEVVTFARPTASYTVYAQQFGRVLRVMMEKLHGIIIDHVGNVLRHGLPDRPRAWTLDRRESRRSNGGLGVVPIRPCPNCTMAYERTRKLCPYCGWTPEPLGRSNPKLVDGDLQELDPTVLANMRREIDRIDGHDSGGLGGIVGRAIDKNHLKRQQHQAPLRTAMHVWANWRELYFTEDTSTIQRRFFFTFGIDVMTACTLGAADADALRALIEDQLERANVVGV